MNTQVCALFMSWMLSELICYSRSLGMTLHFFIDLYRSFSFRWDRSYQNPSVRKLLMGTAVPSIALSCYRIHAVQNIHRTIYETQLSPWGFFRSYLCYGEFFNGKVVHGTKKYLSYCSFRRVAFSGFSNLGSYLIRRRVERSRKHPN